MARNRTTIFQELTRPEREEIIDWLNQHYDPGTFSDLHSLSLAELRNLVDTLTEDAP